MLLRRSTDIYPKELARDMRQFFNSLLENPTRFTDVSMPAKEDIAAKIPAPAFEIS